MKKVILSFVVLVTIFTLSACGVKSELSHIEGDTFPRDYPTY